MTKDLPDGTALVEFGVAPRDAGRPSVAATLPAVADAIDDGIITNLREVPTEIRIRHESALRQMLPTDSEFDVLPRVVFMYGPAGCGKTHLVYELYDRRFVAAITRGNCGLWVRGDLGAPVLLWDEATDSRMDLQTFNLICDGGALLEQKGKQATGRYVVVFVNTNQAVDANVDPQAWFALLPAGLRQTFLRRIGFGARAHGQAQMALFVNWEDRLAADQIAHPTDDEGTRIDRVRAEVRDIVVEFVARPLVVEHRGPRPNPGLAQLGLVQGAVAAVAPPSPPSPPRARPAAGPSVPASPERHRPHVAAEARPTPPGTPLMAQQPVMAPPPLVRADADLDIAAIEADAADDILPGPPFGVDPAAWVPPEPAAEVPDAQPRDADGMPLYGDDSDGNLALARMLAGIDPDDVFARDMDRALDASLHDYVGDGGSQPWQQ